MKKEDREVLQKEIGPHYDTILHKKYNLPATFLGPIWFAYRNCFGLAFLCWAVFLLLSFLFTFLFHISFYILIPFGMLFFCFTSHSLYIKHIQKKIKKQTNKETDLPKAPTSYGTAILFFVISSSITALILILLQVTVFKDYKTNGNLSFQTSGFTLGSNDGSVFIKTEKDRTCFAQIGKLNETGENLMYYYYGFQEDFSNMNPEKINGTTWYTNSSTSREEEKAMIYLTRQGKDTYVLKFYGKEDTDYRLCQKDFEAIKKTVRFS